MSTLQYQADYDATHVNLRANQYQKTMTLRARTLGAYQIAQCRGQVRVVLDGDIVHVFGL
eukprot:2256172-Rhodomonas_salina.2